MKQKMLEILKEILFVSVLVYVLFGAILFVFQKKFIYYPDNSDFSSCNGFDDSEKLDMNGTRAYYKKNSDDIVVFYHGNAGSACDRDFLKDDFKSLGMSYLFVEYAGYSNDNVEPSGKLLKKDVESTVNFLKDKNFSKVIVVGESIGSSLAIYHSTLSDVDKLFLIAPFYRMSDIAKSVYGMYPVSLMIKEKYDSNEWIKNSSAKKLGVIHGEDDEIVPIEQSRRLFEEAPIENKEFFSIQGAHHNDIYEFEEAWEIMRRFLKE